MLTCLLCRRRRHELIFLQVNVIQNANGQNTPFCVYPPTFIHSIHENELHFTLDLFRTISCPISDLDDAFISTILVKLNFLSSPFNNNTGILKT